MRDPVTASLTTMPACYAWRGHMALRVDATRSPTAACARPAWRHCGADRLPPRAVVFHLSCFVSYKRLCRSRDRKSVQSGKSVSVRVDVGGGLRVKKQTTH